jgi:hypothetical protein
LAFSPDEPLLSEILAEFFHQAYVTNLAEPEAPSMSWRSSERLLVAAAVVCLASAVPASATSITFVDTGTVSGSFNGTAFTNQVVTVTGTGDTANVFTPFPGFYELAPLTAPTVTIGGLGTYSLTGDIIAFSTGTNLLDNTSVVGLAQLDHIPDQPGGFTGILGTAQAGLFGYDLQSAIGPVAGDAGVSDGDTSFYKTTGGILHTTSAVAGTGTLTITGGNSTVTTTPGGPTGNDPVQIGTNVSQLLGTIGGPITGDYYKFYWNGGLFSATASVGELSTSADALAFTLTDSGGTKFSDLLLNPANLWTSTISPIALAAGYYTIGINTDSTVDPGFAITFNSGPVSGSPVPEPATMTLTALGLAGVIRRYRRRAQ